MHKTLPLALCILWVTLTGTYAQTCTETSTVAFDLTSNIAINTSTTTCIECRVGGTPPSPVQWLAPGGVLLSGGQHGVTIENNLLVVNDADMFFALGTFPLQLTCSSNLGDRTVSVYRAGFFAPTVTVQNDGPSTITEGDSTNLRCADTNNIPGSASRMWVGPQGESLGFLTILELSNLNRTNSGEYRCQLTNTMDSRTISDSITITVTYPTVVRSNSPATQSIDQGSELTLDCTYDSNPPSSVEWRFEGAVLNTGGNVIISTVASTSTSTLTVSSVISDNTGGYECTAMNTLANGMTTTDRAMFMVTVLLRPSPATNLTVSNIQENSVDLSWVNGFNGGSLITGVRVEVFRGTVKEDTIDKIGDASLQSTTVSDLLPFTEYEFRLYVRNRIDLSDPVIKVAMTLSQSLSAPIMVTVTSPSSTTLNVTWEPPPSVSTVEDPNSWVVELSNNAGVINTTTIQDSATTHYLFPGLVKGTMYGVRVAGVNERGMGAFSNIVYTNTTVDPPEMPASLDGEGVSAFGFEINWTPPADNGGSDIVEYVVRYREVGGGTDFAEVPRGVDEVTLLLRNGGNPTPPRALNYSITYEIQVVAVNVIGRGASANLTVMTQSIDQPQRIFDPLTPSEFTPLTAVVSWMHPGGTVITFLVQHKLMVDEWTDSAKVINVTVPGNMTSVTLRDLNPESSYNVRVRTVNAMGSSVFSLVASFDTALPPAPEVDGPTSVPVGETARINCTSSIPSLTLTWFRLTVNSEGSMVDSPLPPGRARVVDTDLVFTSPTVMDSGTYACRVGASVQMEHTITFIGPDQGQPGISTEVIIIVSVVGGVALLVFLCVIILACYCTCCTKSSSKTSSYNVKSKSKSRGQGKGKKSMTWIETSTKFVPNTNPNYSRKPDEPSPFDMPDDLQGHSSFNTLEKQNRVNQNEYSNTNPGFGTSDV